MSNVAKILLQHIENKDRAKERREDRLYDVVRLAEAREYQEKLDAENKEFKLQERSLNTLERQYLDLISQRKVQEAELQKSNVDLNLVNELYQTKGPEAIINEITDIDYKNFDDLTEYYTTNIKNLNLELDTMKDVLSDGVARVKNVVEGGAIAAYPEGVALGMDREGLDIGDFGIDAYNAIYGEEIDTSGKSADQIKALENEQKIEDAIISDLFDKSGSDMQASLDDFIKTRDDQAKTVATAQYYETLATGNVEDADVKKAAQYETDMRGFIRNSNLNVDFDEYTTLSTLDQSQIDELDSVNDVKVADRIGQIQFEVAYGFLVSQGLEEDFVSMSDVEQQEILNEYFNLYQDMIVKSNSQTETRLGETVQSNFEDYYLYAKEAQRNYNDEGDPAQKQRLEEVIRSIYGVPKLMEIDGFFEQLDIRYGHISGVYDRYNTNILSDPKAQTNILNQKNRVRNTKLINILQGGND
jgi:hypothetical protein